jgi:hypothetical protein
LSKASDLVARMDRLGASARRPAAEPLVEPEARANGRRRRVPARPVHYTIDLDPELHRSLRIFALERRVDASEVVRALLELLDVHQVADLVDGRLDRP